ncbi:bifunctional 4-hydroxy-2-oxoglutarate aldolase/2-dehydro-3-deoxy-phosphogluconate aldolase [Aureliella helgolandensis]|uniref:2-dehydro-3-deoxy-phosphogluconate aldolase n=1 Tax=Aureliella helgolandensis TaxID=2527968 RepID=A0A518GAP9_9BACT|nr:bifunctional 4-hydroxy-2-oxoglutarate aldolase/2-dehydro-3-deoxy-phosphogluconate aldolase [Aureliella helgolandensis]QDV25643.1 KHG/KDPG aldolase [Aureliella helgolandensis]
MQLRSQFPLKLFEQIQSCGIIAVLVIDEVRHAVPLAKALLDGGINVMELTLRTPVALEALQAIRREVPEMVAGIGTILTPAQVDQVAQVGAAFGVAPGLNRRVMQQSQALDLPFAPGIATPSEVEAAVELGCRDLKFFPAEPTGGVAYLSSLNAPYAHLGLRYIPLGGLNFENFISYLSLPFVPAVGGSWIAPRKAIQDEQWEVITSNATESRRLIDAQNFGDAT